MKVGLHQGSILSPLLFVAVIDVVYSEARSGLPSELLYADDLVIRVPTMEQPGRRLADWRASLLGKGLKVNAGKSKVMVGSSDGTIQEVDLAEDLMVDGETYECVKSFCYLGDTLDGDCGADLAATARIRNGCIKIRELLFYIQSFPVGDERSSVCQLRQKQHDLWK